jgi:hypothetical protein
VAEKPTDTDESEDDVSKTPERDAQLAGTKKIDEQLLKVFTTVEEGFRNQSSRVDDQIDAWDLYNCVLNGNQYYSGNSKIYVPIVHNAVEARKTRFTNQLFPKGGRYVDVVSQNGDLPHGETALMEHYVRKAKLRTEMAPALLVNGDIEGQYNVYVGWSTAARHVVWKTKKSVEVEGVKLHDDDALDDAPDEDVTEEIEEDVILEDRPTVEVLSDADVMILPITCNSVEEALEIGGSVTIIRRWTKAQIKQKADEGELDEDVTDDLLEAMSKVESEGKKDMAKDHADAAGIKAKGRVAQVYETWTKIKVGKERRLVVAFFGGDDLILSCKLNPYWNDRCPLISAPVKKIAGVAKGISPVGPCSQLQYAANDAVNEGMDSAAYALLPIIMTDPLKNPRVNSMVLDLAAVWQVDPNSTKFAQFPELWKQAFEIVGACKAEIFQTLSVNPAMMPQGTGGKSKRNQAEIATEQQVDILTTADAVTVLEEGIFTPVLERFAEYDAQFRDEDITVKSYGHMGMRAMMETVQPLQMGRRYSFIWFGVEQARNAAQLQQQISLLNVIRGIPPQLLPGRRINMVPAIENAVAATFGPRIAPLIFEDISKQFSIDPEQENEILSDGNAWPVSPTDEDGEHMQSHLADIKATGDPTGVKRQHVALHVAQMQQKATAQVQAQGQPGTPGGGPPGIAGVPKPGSQPAQPKQKGPNGAINADRMGGAGAVTMPRKM